MGALYARGRKPISSATKWTPGRMQGRQAAEADSDALDLAYRLLNVHKHLLLNVVDSRSIRGADRDGNGLTKDALRPRSDAGRGDGVGCEGRSSPRVQCVLGEAARREAARLLISADRRVLKLRYGCVPAFPQTC